MPRITRSKQWTWRKLAAWRAQWVRAGQPMWQADAADIFKVHTDTYRRWEHNPEDGGTVPGWLDLLDLNALAHKAGWRAT